MDKEESLRAAIATWPADVRPIVHWSESPPEEVAARCLSKSKICAFSCSDARLCWPAVSLAGEEAMACSPLIWHACVPALSKHMLLH